MHEMDTKVEAARPNNWDDSYIADPDMIKEEGFNNTIKLEPELEENDLHNYPTAVKDESVEHSDGTESEVEAINPYTIKEEGVSVSLKSESELEGNGLDDDPTTIKYKVVEHLDGAKSEIEASSPYKQEDEDIVSLDSIKEESCEDKYEAYSEPEAVDSPHMDDSDIASSISVKEVAIKNVNTADLHLTQETFCADRARTMNLSTISIYWRGGLDIRKTTKATTTLELLSYWSRVSPLGLPTLGVSSSNCMKLSQKARH
jgi:hypothetical protein